MTQARNTPRKAITKKGKPEAKANPVLLLGGGLVLGGLIYYLGTAPLMAKVAETQSQRANLEAEVAHQRAVIDKLPQLKGDNARLEKQLEISKKQFPRKEQFSELINEIDSSARAANVRSDNYKRMIDPSDIPGVDHLTVSARFSGNYDDVMQVLNEIDSQQRYINVEQLSLNTVAQGGVNADATFGSYLLREVPSTGAAGDGAAPETTTGDAQTPPNTSPGGK